MISPAIRFLDPSVTPPNPTRKGARLVFLVGSVLLVVSMTGCGPAGPTTYPVEGQVLFLDGRPVEQGTVEFRSEQDQGTQGRTTARGKIDSQGRFHLTTFTEGDGALPGWHQVIVQQMVISQGIPHHQHGPPVPSRYADYARSGLRAEVQPQAQNRITIQLERSPSSSP